MRTRRHLAYVLASALVLFVGCSDGDSGDSGDDTTLEQPFTRRTDLVQAEIVVKAYEEGRLGTLEQVAADMVPYFDRPGSGVDPTPKPFDDEGHFIPFTEMDDEQLAAFEVWHNGSDLVNSVVGAEKQAAVREILEEPDGEDE